MIFFHRKIYWKSYMGFFHMTVYLRILSKKGDTNITCSPLVCVRKSFRFFIVEFIFPFFPFGFLLHNLHNTQSNRGFDLVLL